jgi:hypothetical protein
MIFGFFWAKPAKGTSKLAANASQKTGLGLVIAVAGDFRIVPSVHKIAIVPLDFSSLVLI